MILAVLAFLVLRPFGGLLASWILRSRRDPRWLILALSCGSVVVVTVIFAGTVVTALQVAGGARYLDYSVSVPLWGGLAGVTVLLYLSVVGVAALVNPLTVLEPPGQWRWALCSIVGPFVVVGGVVAMALVKASAPTPTVPPGAFAGWSVLGLPLVYFIISDVLVAVALHRAVSRFPPSMGTGRAVR